MPYSSSLTRLLRLLAAILCGLGLGLAALLAGQAQAAALQPANRPAQISAAPVPADLFAHLGAGRRLHWIVASPDLPPGSFAAPDGDWSAAGDVAGGVYTATQAYALRAVPVALFRSSVQDSAGQDVAWENKDLEAALQNVYLETLHHTVVTETQLAGLAPQGVLILPAIKRGYEAAAAEALGSAGQAALRAYIEGGGTVYAQGNAAYLLEAAGALPAGTVHLDTPLLAPDDLGQLRIDAPLHPLAFNWQTDRLWLLQDPALSLPPGFEAVATYTNTLDGPQPAILSGAYGQGRVILAAGHATSALHRDQLPIFTNALLWGMAERAELYGRAIQTYDPRPGPTVIPAYEANVPISASLCVDHLWAGAVFSQAIVTERVAAGFDVDPASVQPAAASLVTDTTGTSLTWELGDLSADPACLHYTAYTRRDALAPGQRTFSQGELTFSDGLRRVTWAHQPFSLSALMPARLFGQHDKEPDRFYSIPKEGVILDEFVFLENKEESRGYNLKLVRYIPLVAPVVGLEDQRQPLASNAGETVWMRNEFFLFKNGDYLLPEGFTSPTQTLNLDTWDGTTVVTMTTPGGYHIDPLGMRLQRADGFFITIPPSYTHAITLTADHKLVLPAARLEWNLGDFPGFWYEMPAVRYGIESRELLGRAVSFTSDPLTDTLVVNAKGGSVYTGLGGDPTLERGLLTPVIVAPPQPPDLGGLTYQDVWSRTHELGLRAGFYDVFDYAECVCGDLRERHQRLNVTFAIWADTDADGVGDTLLTDYDVQRGSLPTRVTGDLDLYIKTRNLADYGVSYDQNLIEGRIFRGLGYTIQPRSGDWFTSYESPYSQLVSTTVEGGYETLTFRQNISAGMVNTIRIHARVDATARELEELLKLHDGFTFVYRQGFAGAAQYEIHDTHVQGVQGVRSDAAIDTWALPAALSTYSDTFFTGQELTDRFDPRRFEKDVYLASWGFDQAAATTYVGGREGRELFFSLLRLGDRTWVRVELNNNTDQDWSDVLVSLAPPEGITVTRLFTQNVPPPMWPDLPFLNLTTIPDAAYGIYYFELRSDPNALALQGQVIDIPVQVSGQGLPAGFAAPPARLGVRAANAPEYNLGLAHDLFITDTLNPAVTPLEVRLLGADEVTQLRALVAQDEAVVPNTHLASEYYHTQGVTLPLSFNNGQITITLPDQTLPLIDPSEPLYAVTFNAFTGTRATRYPVNQGATLNFTDDFGLRWTAVAEPDFVEASGAALQASYTIEGITRLLTDEPVDLLYAYENNRVVIGFDIYNDGTDVAASTVVTIALVDGLTPVDYPASLTALDQRLRWQVGDLGPGASKTVTATFEMFANPSAASRLARRPAATYLWGYLPALVRSDANFVNTLSGQVIRARVAEGLRLPFGKDKAPYYLNYLPILAQQNALPLQFGQAITRRPVTSRGEVFYRQTVRIPTNLPTGGHFYLSSNPSLLQPVLVDDLVALMSGGQDVFTYNFSVNRTPAPALVEVPAATLNSLAGQTVTIEYRDVYAQVVEASAIWLIWVP